MKDNGYTVANYSTAIHIKDYMANYRDADKFIGYCKACNRYNTCCACLPFDFDTKEYINSYQTAYIIGTKIMIDTDVIRENTGWELCPCLSPGQCCARGCVFHQTESYDRKRYAGFFIINQKN